MTCYWLPTDFICYWLVKLTDPKGEGEAIGIFSFTEDEILSITFAKLSHVFGLRHNEWTWIVISKVEFETYQAFGFKEYSI